MSIFPNALSNVIFIELVSYGAPCKVPESGGLKMTEIYSLRAVEDNLKSRCCKATISQKAL